MLQHVSVQVVLCSKHVPLGGVVIDEELAMKVESSHQDGYLSRLELFDGSRSMSDLGIALVVIIKFVQNCD